MSDSNEEQLLTELLNGIAREDAHLGAAHLEARVIDAVDASPTVHLSVPREMPATFSVGRHFFAVAAIAMAALVPGVVFLTRDVPTAATKVQVKPVEHTLVEIPAVPSRPRVSTQPAPRAPRTRRTEPNPTNLTNPTNPTNPTEEFVPLMPMTEQELAGPFQLVRVQMPRASLGPLQSSLKNPNELVEADVLLGEDGMARAIRVSTSGAVYPWRSR